MDSSISQLPSTPSALQLRRPGHLLVLGDVAVRGLPFCAPSSAPAPTQQGKGMVFFSKQTITVLCRVLFLFFSGCKCSIWGNQRGRMQTPKVTCNPVPQHSSSFWVGHRAHRFPRRNAFTLQQMNAVGSLIISTLPGRTSRYGSDESLTRSQRWFVAALGWNPAPAGL